MAARKLLVLLAVGAFLLSLASPGVFAGMGAHEIKGTVTRIEGKKVTIKDGMGMEKTVEPANPEALSGLKVGDEAAIKEGVLTKGGGAGPSAPSRGGGY